ncbi:hypothetical protein LAZ67_2003555 [Cordylochernes scorpioides]|uniref:Mos1 transposase HTH domain-containing protein n=1 Tax=Cordylochernes scorpioides TaxID=51811 RepID=A0ABY6K305_9ARAC|nr:hypothetical protein LAZ67_2003555 [Cordylochernes scorpioides]
MSNAIAETVDNGRRDLKEATNAVIGEEAKDVLNSPASIAKVVDSKSVVIPDETIKLINIMNEEINGQNQREQRLFEVKPFARASISLVTEMEDQRICIKFCVKNGFKGAEIFCMLQTAYGDAVMSRRRVFEWYKRFKEGREETADNERSGRPSTSTTPEKVDKVLELVREDRRITVREVAEEAGISFGSTQSIMKDILGVRRLNAVLVPKDLTFDQKNARKETASLNLEATTDDPELLKRVITGDETWIYGF